MDRHERRPRRRRHGAAGRAGVRLGRTERQHRPVRGPAQGGVIDPAKVTRSALQNAASIAALLLTTEALVADKPEKKDAGAAAGGGMGHGRHGWYGRHGDGNDVDSAVWCCSMRGPGPWGSGPRRVWGRRRPRHTSLRPLQVSSMAQPWCRPSPGAGRPPGRRPRSCRLGPWPPSWATPPRWRWPGRPPGRGVDPLSSRPAHVVKNRTTSAWRRQPGGAVAPSGRSSDETGRGASRIATRLPG